MALLGLVDVLVQVVLCADIAGKQIGNEVLYFHQCSACLLLALRARLRKESLNQITLSKGGTLRVLFLKDCKST